MCLVLYSREEPVKIAEEDITVWKLLREKYEKGKLIYGGIWWPYNYIIGDFTRVEPLLKDGRLVSKGYHTLETVGGAVKMFKSLDHYHSGYKDLVVVECIIPKGSEYYYGIAHDPIPGYASSQLKIIKKCV
jgi:hypothetical protein